MKSKGFAALVEEGLRGKVHFRDEHHLLKNLTHVDVMMLQLVQRAVQGDSKALRRILMILNETKPAPARTTFRIFTTDIHGNVVEELGTETIVLGPLSAFPNLPQTSGPMPVPKEWLKPMKATKRRYRTVSMDRKSDTGGEEN